MDAHSRNGAASVSLSLLLVYAVHNTFMNGCIHLPLSLPNIEDQKLLTRHGLSFSGWGRERVSVVFDYNGGQYIRKGQ